MIRNPLPTACALLGAILLTACGDDKPVVVGGNPDTQAAELAKAPPVALPPSVTASKSYRCGSDVVYADFLSDGSANLRTDKAGTPTHLAAAEGSETLTAEGGWSIDGKGDTVTIGTPSQKARSCKA